MRRTVRIRFRPRWRLGARERDDLQGLRECGVRENVPLVPGARARARVLGVPVAGLRVRRVHARLTAGDNHPVGGAADRRDLVRRTVPNADYVNVSRHPSKVTARMVTSVSWWTARRELCVRPKESARPSFRDTRTYRPKQTT